MEKVTEIKVQCTCGNNAPRMDIITIDEVTAIRIRCDCKAGYIRVLHVAEEDEVLKSHGVIEER